MPDYRVQVRGIGGLLGGAVELDCETDDQALVIAWSIESPYGHAVCAGDRLLGVFEAGWGAGFPEPPAEDDDED
jgi:hypothetical protein